MQELQGARLQGDTVILDPGQASDFFRRQIKENLPAITQAASKVFGKNVRVLLGDGQTRDGLQQPASQPAASQFPAVDPMERAKREPVVKSFLDVFPGPVKAEKIDK